MPEAQGHCPVSAHFGVLAPPPSHASPPPAGYCTREVLVETFEPGRSVAAFIRTPHPQNTQASAPALPLCCAAAMLAANLLPEHLSPPAFQALLLCMLPQRWPLERVPALLCHMSRLDSSHALRHARPPPRLHSCHALRHACPPAAPADCGPGRGHLPEDAAAGQLCAHRPAPRCVAGWVGERGRHDMAQPQAAAGAAPRAHEPTLRPPLLCPTVV